MIKFILVGKSTRVGIQVLQAIRSFSPEKCMVIGSQESVSLSWSMLCAEHVLLDLDGVGDDYFVYLINKRAAKTPGVVLIPFDCAGMRLAARVRSRLNLQIIPTPELATVDMFDDKWTFHEFCIKNSLLVPETRFIGSKTDLNFELVTTELGLPFILKPTRESGSLGVQIIESRQQFEENILNDPDYDFSRLIAQRYIAGIDMGLSLFSVKGRLCSFSIQRPTGLQLDFVPNAHLKEIALKICQTSGYHGVMHVDIRLEKKTGKLFLIESNPRFWASLTASVWCGMNFVAQSIDPPPEFNEVQEIQEVQELTSGTFYRRNPLIRPSSWRSLVFDRGAGGRLLRAIAFDWFTLGTLIKELPVMARRFAHRRTGSRFKFLELKK